MKQPVPFGTLRTAAMLLPAIALLAACSHQKEMTTAPPPPVVDIVEVKVPELDGRGSYRFMMSDGDTKMTADEFDAWMKANGIRVAKGNGQTQVK